MEEPTITSNYEDYPNVKELASNDVFAEYGLTMSYAQQFELTFRGLMLMLHASGYTGLSSEEIDALFEKPGKPKLRRTVEKIISFLKEIGNPLPDNARRLLIDLVEWRNDLAHDYLVRNGWLLQRAGTRELLIEELQTMSFGFMRMTRTFGKLEEMFLRMFVTDDEIEEYEDLFKQVTEEMIEKKIAEGKGRQLT